MKIIDRKNYFATVCEVYAMLSIGKIWQGSIICPFSEKSKKQIKFLRS